MKKITPILALALSLSLLSGCAAEQKTSFNHYWNQNAHVFEKLHEELEYAVTFTKGSSYGYDLSYSEGTFKTTLKSQTTSSGYLYVYASELSVKVTYTFNGQSAEFIDRVTTEVQFSPSDGGLKPISSKKFVKSASPMTVSPVSLQGCYALYEYDVATTYETNGGTTVLTEYEKDEKGVLLDTQTTEKSFTVDNQNLSYLDNEQLLVALRAMPASVSSTKVQAYSPFTASVQKINVVFGQTAEGDFTFSKNGSEGSAQKISYRPVQIQLDEKNPGMAQTAWIASVTATNANTHRNVMLRLETPVYQALGTLVYTLTSVNYY